MSSLSARGVEFSTESTLSGLMFVLIGKEVGCSVSIGAFTVDILIGRFVGTSIGLLVGLFAIFIGE